MMRSVRPTPLVLALVLVPFAARAQAWRAGTDIDLVRRAVAHRAARDADTLLASWQAEAHGMVRMASILDQGAGPVERVIKADELRVEVYGVAPNRSKQIITAWRDTTFLPNTIRYHRDHLGIVANDFGGMIRLGEGDEVRDIVHPLSEAGLTHYVFAMGDTLSISTPTGKVRVAAVEVRPADPNAPGTVGTLYLDIDRAALIRFRFTFTRASYRDGTVEDITVVLENSLLENARWLPWHQSIVIRRGIAWIDLPIRTIIRADWTIDKYQLGVVQAPNRFVGPFIGGYVRATPGGTWSGPIGGDLVGLPPTDFDVQKQQDDAMRELSGRLLSGLPRTQLSGHGVSDFLRVNRVEGITLAFGTRIALGGAFEARVRAGYGISDQRVTGLVALERQFGSTRWTLTGERAIRDVGDQQVISGLSNSIGTLMSGDDYGDYTLLDRMMLGMRTSIGATKLAVEAGREWSTSVTTTFSPVSGTADPNPALGSGAVYRFGADVSRLRSTGDGWALRLDAGASDSSWIRGLVHVRTRLPIGTGALQFTGDAGAGSVNLPGYRSFVFGGLGTLLGVPYRAMGGRRMARAEVAWVIPVAFPTPRFPYSRYVRLPSTLAPFLAAGIAGGEMPDLPWHATGVIEPVAGLRFDLWGPLLRLEGGVSLRTGRIGVAFDVHPDWWPLF